MRSLALATILIGLVACQTAAPPAPPRLRPVAVERVNASGGKRPRTFSGSARAGLASRLSFRVAGTILELPARLGDRVGKDQVIARLDPKDFRLQVDDAEASLRQAQAQSRSVAANYERIRGLYENNSVSISDLDAARAANDSAQAQVQSIAKKLELAKSQLSYTELRAPLAGNIAELKAEVNENIAPGQAIAVLNAGSRPEVTFAVPEQLIAEISVGDALVVRFGALPDQEFKATVTEVGVAANALAATYPVVARLDQAEEKVLPGMAAETALVFGKSDGSTRLCVRPKAAVQDQNGQTFVFLAVPAKDGTATVARRNITTGDLTAEGLEVSDGLNDGDLVIIAGLRFLSEGQVVALPQHIQE